MVFVVIAYVVGEVVEASVVRPSLLIKLVEQVVLRNEVASTGVQRSRKEGRHDEVPQRP